MSDFVASVGQRHGKHLCAFGQVAGRAGFMVFRVAQWWDVSVVGAGCSVVCCGFSSLRSLGAYREARRRVVAAAVESNRLCGCKSKRPRGGGERVWRRHFVSRDSPRRKSRLPTCIQHHEELRCSNKTLECSFAVNRTQAATSLARSRTLISSIYRSCECTDAFAL